MIGFVAGGVLAVLMLLWGGELFAAAVLTATWIGIIGLAAVASAAERKVGADGPG